MDDVPEPSKGLGLVVGPHSISIQRLEYGGGDSQLQQAQFTFLTGSSWRVFGKQLTPLKPTTKEDAWLAEKKAIVSAAIVSEELKMEDWRRKHLRPPPKEPEPTTEVYKTWSLNPLAPLLRPIQKALLKNVRKIRLCRTRDWTRRSGVRLDLCRGLFSDCWTTVCLV